MGHIYLCTALRTLFGHFLSDLRVGFAAVFDLAQELQVVFVTESCNLSVFYRRFDATGRLVRMGAGPELAVMAGFSDFWEGLIEVFCC